MLEPASMSPGSVMPTYGWLFKQNIDTTLTPGMIRVMQTLGVPYEKGYDAAANTDLMEQASAIRGRLAGDKIKVSEQREIVALIAYLQRMGTDIKVSAVTQK